MISKQVQALIIGACFFSLIFSSALLFTVQQGKTHFDRDVPLTSGDIPAPIITNIQQTPPRDDVGYFINVNVTCDVQTAASLTLIQINWTNADWVTDAQADMTGPGGNGTYWGLISGYTVGIQVRYHIIAEDALGNRTISAEHNYTIIDNVGPDITHQNTSAWVDPLSPFGAPPVPKVLIECQVTDLYASVSVVYLVATEHGFFTNLSIIMNYDFPFNYNFSLDVLISSGNIEYYFNATDSYGNYAVTKIFTLTIDTDPPQVVSWEGPTAPDYTEAPHLYANLTDLNPVSVALKWSEDWVTNHTVSMSNIGGNTWQTDSTLPVLPWNTTVHWEINASDGKFTSIQYFSYQVADSTPPDVTLITYGNATPDQPLDVYVTMSEPVNASGIQQAYLYYGLSSEGYAMHRVDLVNLSGTLWRATIPGQAGETVRWYIYVEDQAGNNYTSTTYEYTVGGGLPLELLLALGISIAVAVVVIVLLIRRRKRSVLF